ncbi:hypothetical protein PSACC_01605 [Paramicrosporidium saccamoebae]|uniref:Uncharacterized protein n=1 Tax=Paramicrosporidium saccamoebae TaxID=1246581 RepID=A0A2H9TLG3_9FUNG|nr:hypothetical protein PSACC_01605 [Paramicrosporidium saccamoebae]
MKSVALITSLFVLTNASYRESFWGIDAGHELSENHSSPEESPTMESRPKWNDLSSLTTLYLQALQEDADKAPRVATRLPRRSTASKMPPTKQLSRRLGTRKVHSRRVLSHLNRSSLRRSDPRRPDSRRPSLRLSKLRRFSVREKSREPSQKRRVELGKAKSSVLPVNSAESSDADSESPSVPEEATEPTAEQLTLSKNVIEALPQMFRDAHACPLKKLEPQEVIDRFSGVNRDYYMILMNDPYFYGPDGDMTVEKLATLTPWERTSLIYSALSDNVEGLSKTVGPVMVPIIRALLSELTKLGISKTLTKWIETSGDNAVMSQSHLLWSLVYGALGEKGSVNNLFARSFRRQLKRVNPAAARHNEFIRKVRNGDFETFDALLGACMQWMAANGLDRIQDTQ